MQLSHFFRPTLKTLSIIVVVGVTLSFSPTWQSAYKPILMERSQLEKAVQLQEPRPIVQAGKIYLKDNYIFVSESMKGIHIIDNTDPTNPENIGFIHIDGCIDMAMKGDILYADNAVDLIAIKLNPTLTEIEVSTRIPEVFPEFETPDNIPLSREIRNSRTENTVIVGWELIND